MITFFFHLLSSRKEMKDNRRPEQSLCPAAKLSLVNDVKWKWKSVCDDWQWCCSAGPAVLVSNLHSLFLLLSYICSVRGKLWGRGVEAWVLGLDPSVFSELVTHQIQSRREFLLFIKVTATHTHTHFLIVLWFVSLERKVFFSEIEKIHTFRRFTGAGRSRINRGANGDAVIVPADIFVWKLCLKCERLSWPLSPCLIHRTSLCHCQRERVRIWVREFRLFTAKTRDEAFQ